MSEQINFNIGKYKIIKPQKHKAEYHLEEDILEKKVKDDVIIAEKQIEANKAKLEQEAKILKSKNPLKFCIIHKILFETEEQYIKHTIRNHKQIALEEELAQFQCENCGDVFVRFSNSKTHADTCTGLKKYITETQALTPRQKYLAKQGEQLRMKYQLEDL